MKNFKKTMSKNCQKQISLNKMSYTEFHFLDKKILEKALTYLQHQKRIKVTKDDNCKFIHAKESRSDHQIKLRCRQLTHVVKELRKAILKHDWDETAALLTILSLPGIKLYNSIVMRICFILLFCHSYSSNSLIQVFTRKITGYLFEDDIIKFIKVLFILKKLEWKSFTNTKHNYFKVITDPEFYNIN